MLNSVMTCEQDKIFRINIMNARWSLDEQTKGEYVLVNCLASVKVSQDLTKLIFVHQDMSYSICIHGESNPDQQRMRCTKHI